MSTSTDFTQNIEVNGKTPVVRRKNYTVLAGEQRFSTDAATIEGLEKTPRLNKGYTLIKPQPEDKTVYHLQSKLTGLVENRGEDGQVITDEPITQLPVAQGYEVDENGVIKTDAEGECILGPNPLFESIIISGRRPKAGSTEDPEKRWEFLKAANSTAPLYLASLQGSWRMLEAESSIRYFTKGTAVDFNQLIPRTTEPIWLFPNAGTDDEITMQLGIFQQISINGVDQTIVPSNQYTIPSSIAVATPEFAIAGGLVSKWNFFTLNDAPAPPAALSQNVINFTANTGDIDETSYNENTLYILNRESSNTSDLTLTRGGTYGAYEIRTAFVKLDTNTASIPAGQDVALFISGNEIKLYSLGSSQQTTSSTSAQIGQLYEWFRTDTPPVDKLIPVSGQIINNADTTYPDVWALRNFIPAIDSFNDGAKTITMKNYNAEGYFTRFGNIPGTAQPQSTALPTTAFTGQTDSAGAHSHTVPTNGGTGGGIVAPEKRNPNAIPGTDLIQTSTAPAHAHTTSVTGGGDAETKPKNISVLACIIAAPL